MALFSRFSLRTQVALVIVVTVLAALAVSAGTNLYFMIASQTTSARDGQTDVLRFALPTVIAAAPDMRNDIARAFRTPISVLLVEDRSGVWPDKGDVADPQRAEAAAAFLRAQGLKIAEAEAASRSLMVPKNPPRLKEHLSGVLKLVEPANGAALMQSRTPRFAGPPTGDTSQNIPGGYVRATTYILSVRLEGDSHWYSLYTLHPLRLPVGPVLLQIFAVAPIFLLLIVAAVFITTRIMGPLGQLVGAAEALGRGGRPEPVAGRGSSDVRELISVFNNMSERVGNSIDYQIALLQSIGHDLKGPLASISLLLHRIEPKETVEQISARLEQANDIVGAIMSFTRATMRDGEIVKVDLTSLVDALVEEQREEGREIDADLTENIVIPARYNAVSRAIRNVLENALNYGEKASVKLSTDAKTVVLEIVDDGPGIPEDRLNDVFQPFTRFAEDDTGTGLGLSIAKAIVVDHGGTLELANTAGSGLRATLRFNM